MTKFKIDYDPGYSAFKYSLYREEPKFLWITQWIKINSYEKLEEAIAAVSIAKDFPQYLEV